MLGFAQGIGQSFFERDPSVIGGIAYCDGRLEIAIRDSSKPSRLGKTAPIITILAAEGKTVKTECPPLTQAQPADHHDDDDTQNPYKDLRPKLHQKQPPTGGSEVWGPRCFSILIESLGTKRTTKSIYSCRAEELGREKGDSCRLRYRFSRRPPPRSLAQMARGNGFFPFNVTSVKKYTLQNPRIPG